MYNIRELKLIVLLIGSMCFISCMNVKEHDPLGRILIRELTFEETILPRLRYQLDFSVGKIDYIGIPSLNHKPQIEWSIELTEGFSDVRNVFVDSEGGIWYTYFPTSLDSLASSGYAKLVRLNPDGSTSWTRNINYISSPKPVLVGNSYVVVLDEFLLHDFEDTQERSLDTVYQEKQAGNDSNRMLSLECIDLSGETIWRSHPVLSNITFPNAWYMSDSRIVLAATYDKPVDYHIFDLKSGELLDQLSLAGYKSNSHRSYKPIELSNNDLIAIDDHSILCYDLDSNLKWQHEVQFQEGSSYFDADSVVSTDKYLFYSSFDYLAAIDIETGKIAWKHDKYQSYRTAGIVDDKLLAFVRLENESLSEYDSEISISPLLPVYEVFMTLTKYLRKLYYEGKISLPLLIKEVLLAFLQHDPRYRVVLPPMTPPTYERYLSLSKLDFEGNIIWSAPDSLWAYLRFHDYMVIYEDGSILYKHPSGIRFRDSGGSILWELGSEDFGLNGNIELSRCNILPSPADRIVIAIEYIDVGADGIHVKLFSLK